MSLQYEDSNRPGNKTQRREDAKRKEENTIEPPSRQGRQEVGAKGENNSVCACLPRVTHEVVVINDLMW